MNANCVDKCFCFWALPVNNTCLCPGTSESCWVNGNDFGLYVTEMFFGIVLNTILVGFACFALIRTLRRMEKLKVNLKVSILLILIVAGIFRILYYCIDPHNSMQIFGNVSNLIYAIPIILWIE